MEPFVGQIQAFGFDFAPRGWAKCEGQLLPINENTSLYSLLGTTYGGDGRNTFGLPDLRSRTAIGQGRGPGLSPYRSGDRGGVEFTRITTLNLPGHSHTTSVEATSEGNTDNPTGSVVAGNGVNSFGTVADTYLSSENTGNTGDGQPLFNLPPYLAINYCIALVGLYPSRS